MTAVQEFLARARARIAGERALVWAARGLLAGGAAALAVELAFRRFPVEPAWPVLAACAAVALIFAAGGWIRAWPAWAEVARIVDADLGGKERLTTALEFAGVEGYLPSRQRFDAQAWVAGADVSALRSGGWPVRTAAAGLAALALAVVLAILPNPALDQLRLQHQAQAAQAQAAAAVGQIAKQEATSRPGEDPAQRQALQQELQATKSAVQNAPNPSSAVAALSQAQNIIRAMEDPNLAAKQQAAAQAGQALAAQAGPAQQAGQKLAAQDPRGAAGDLRQVAQNVAAMPAADRAALASQLQSAAQAAQSGNPALAQSLQQAATALQQGDPAAAQQALNQAASQLDQQAGAQDFQGDANQAINQLQQAKTPLDQAAQAQAAAQAGQQGQPAAGQPGAAPSGQGQQPGQGQGQGQGQGAGQGQGQGQGTGTGTGSGQGQGQGSSAGSGGGQSGGGTAAKSTDKVYVQGQGTPTGNGQNQGPGQAGTDTALVPYQQVYADYQAAALNQVDRQDIPQQERDLVRQYFSDLGNP